MQGEAEPVTCSRFTGACINLINLNTASSSLRLKEIALRKSVGATRGLRTSSDFLSTFEIELLESSDGISLVFKLFSAIAIFIAFMGLIGLSQFNNSRPTKEVGIHKVNGAHTASVINLLLSDFIKLVLISNLVAFLLA